MHHLLFPHKTCVKDAALVLLKEKGGKFFPLRVSMGHGEAHDEGGLMEGLSYKHFICKCMPHCCNGMHAICLLQEPTFLAHCVVSMDPETDEVFELTEMHKDLHLIKV